MNPEQVRAQILELARQYVEARQSVPFVPGKSYIPASGKVLEADDLCGLLDSCLDMHLTGGRFTQGFEKEFGAWLGEGMGSRMVTSGSAANLLAVAALTSPRLGEKRLQPGDEVLTVAAGFPTTVAPIVQHGLLPVFVDVEPATANVDVERLAEAVTVRTRAIVLAHTLGNPFDLGAVTALAQEHGLYLIEDCCDALGATYGGRPVSGFGDLSTFSFYPAHQMTTGEGGAVAGHSEHLMGVVESFRDWGRDCHCPPGWDNTCGRRFSQQHGQMPAGYDHKYIYAHLGYNLKATEMQAALGLSQLAKVPRFVARRRENFMALKEALLDHDLQRYVVLPEATAGSEPSWFGFLVSLRPESGINRRDAVEYLEAHGVGTRMLFAGNMIRQPAFRGVAHRVHGGLEHTDRLMNHAFWVGVWPGIDEEARAYMVATFKNMVMALKGRA